MKKKLLSIALVLVFALGCMGTASAVTPVTDYRTYITTGGEMETWCIQKSQGAGDLNYLTNCIDGLLTNDPYGNLAPNVAKEWYSEDGGQTWTFVLNEGIQWVNADGEPQAETVAEDWLWGLEFILNIGKNTESANTSMPMEMIAGAEDYYNYTKTLDPEEAAALDLETFKTMVGIEAVDDYTLVYKLKDKYSYFPTLACYNCLYPISGALLEQLGPDGYYAVSPEDLWYNGPYTCTSFIHGNEKIFTANPNYWNADNVTRFDRVTVKCVESADTAFLNFSAGDLDTITLTQSNLSTIYNNENNDYHDFLVESRPDKYSYQIKIVWNKNKLKDGSATETEPDVNWNTAIANENFRKALYYGLDRVPYLERQNFISPLKCENLTYTAENVATTSTGVDYTQLVRDELGVQYDYEKEPVFDQAKADEYKAKAIEELTAKGVTFPVSIDYYIQGSNQTALDTATVWKQSISDTLGDDFVVLNICSYVSSLTQEVRNPRLASIYVNGWGADFGDPINFLGQETYGEPNAYYAVNYVNTNDITDPDLIATYEEFTKMVREAAAITDDNDARLAAFAKAEAYMIDHVLTIPWMHNISWYLTTVNPYSQVYSAYGIQSNRWVNWETNFDLWTTADIEGFAEAYNAGIGG